MHTYGQMAIGKAFGASRGIGAGIHALASRTQGSGRAMTQLSSTRCAGNMNTPEKSQMHKSIFYLPRNDEMTHENKLIENHLRFKNLVLQ